MYVSTMCGINAEFSHIEFRDACSHHSVLKSAKLPDSALIPVAARSKAWVCGRSLAGVAGSNPTRSMDVCLL